VVLADVDGTEEEDEEDDMSHTRAEMSLLCDAMWHMILWWIATDESVTMG
jgi:hypothetical protein